MTHKVQEEQQGYAEEVARSLAEHFDKKGLTYEFDEEKGSFTMDFQVHCELAEVSIFIQCWPDGFSSYTYCPFTAEAHCVAQVAEYLFRINYELHIGCFDFNQDRGSILFRYSARTGNVRLNEDQLFDAYALALAYYERYGDGLLAIAEGEKTPLEAFQEARKKKA